MWIGVLCILISVELIIIQSLHRFYDPDETKIDYIFLSVWKNYVISYSNKNYSIFYTKIILYFFFFEKKARFNNKSTLYNAK